MVCSLGSLEPPAEENVRVSPCFQLACSFQESPTPWLEQGCGKQVFKLANNSNLLLIDYPVIT